MNNTNDQLKNPKKKILIATPVHTDQLILPYVTSIFQIINNKDSPFEVNVFC